MHAHNNEKYESGARECEISNKDMQHVVLCSLSRPSLAACSTVSFALPSSFRLGLAACYTLSFALFDAFSAASNALPSFSSWAY